MSTDNLELIRTLFADPAHNQPLKLLIELTIGSGFELEGLRILENNPDKNFYQALTNLENISNIIDQDTKQK